MERHQLLDIGGACNLAAGARRQMAGSPSLADVVFQKRSFAEKEVGLVRQRGQGGAVGCRIGQIGRIDQFFRRA